MKKLKQFYKNIKWLFNNDLNNRLTNLGGNPLNELKIYKDEL